MIQQMNRGLISLKNFKQVSSRCGQEESVFRSWEPPRRGRPTTLMVNIGFASAYPEHSALQIGLVDK